MYTQEEIDNWFHMSQVDPLRCAPPPWDRGCLKKSEISAYEAEQKREHDRLLHEACVHVGTVIGKALNEAALKSMKYSANHHADGRDIYGSI